MGFERRISAGSVLSVRETVQTHETESARAARLSREEPHGASATVHLVDDDCSFLAATSRSLACAGFVATAFNSATELLSRVSAETRGCVVTDLDMPDMTGLELQALLRLRGVGMPVVFLTGDGDIPSSVQAMRGGAVDFLEKPAPTERLLAAIIRALETDVETYATRMRVEDRRRRIATLTEREREVFALVARGMMNKQIAAVLGIHERTVKLHRTAITTKLGVHAAAQLAVMASEAGLLETDTLSPTLPPRASVSSLPARYPPRRTGFRESELVTPF
jgi:FixJ family two-component response regulator